MTTYQLALSALGVRAAFAKPCEPRTKGKIERFFSFLQRDFLAEVSTQVQRLAQLNERLGEWVEWYNWRRPHASLERVMHF
jgi:transposase InsO family protein